MNIIAFRISVSQMFRKEEIVVESRCEVKMDTLRMSGAYKCAASVPNHPDPRYRAYSSEFPITVVGIEPVKIFTDHLIAGQSGEINLEVFLLVFLFPSEGYEISNWESFHNIEDLVIIAFLRLLTIFLLRSYLCVFFYSVQYLVYSIQ